MYFKLYNMYFNYTQKKKDLMHFHKYNFRPLLTVWILFTSYLDFFFYHLMQPVNKRNKILRFETQKSII